MQQERMQFLGTPMIFTHTVYIGILLQSKRNQRSLVNPTLVIIKQI